MKKITTIVAVLGTFYFANAQVGIGTSRPASSSQLEISSSNKGILIPRVELSSTENFSPINGIQVESLLVYNTETSGTGLTAVSPGFYYWVPEKGSIAAHWERIVNQTQLDEAISNITDLQGDVSKMMALLKIAYPSNNLIDPATSGDNHGGGMVFTPGANPIIEYVYFDGTNYVKKNITSDIVGLIRGSESKTTFIEHPANSGKFYYISEQAIQANNNVVPTSPFSSGTTLLDGVVLIDVPGEVAQNFSTFLTEITNIANPNSSTNFTVEQVIKNLIEQYSDNNITGTMVYTPGNNLTDASFTYLLQDGSQSSPVSFSSIVQANETKTKIDKTNVSNVLNYVYTAEPALDGSPRTFTLNITQDLIDQITNNQNVINAINNLGGVHYNGTTSGLVVGNVTIPAKSFYTIDAAGNGKVIDIDPTIINGVVNNFETILNQDFIQPITVDGQTIVDVKEYITHISRSNGANVGYTTTPIAAGTPAGQLAIPANSFYSINLDGTKTLIDISGAVVNIISNKKEEIKNILGDKFTSNNTSVYTGNTITINNTIHYIYKGVFTTVVEEGTAETNGITLDISAERILSANLYYSLQLSPTEVTNGLTASLTDIKGSGTTWSMNVGVGDMYNVLSKNSNINAEVIVEFASTTAPAGI